VGQEPGASGGSCACADVGATTAQALTAAATIPTLMSVR
jgi:hypothetical protein